jgi:GNAT superfamily N-acetyltransferase
MITGRWGKPSQVLLDISVDEQGNVTGIANPGRENAPITLGKFDAGTRTVHLEGSHEQEGQQVPFAVDGRLDGRTLRLTYVFGEMNGDVELVRVEDYVPPSPTLVQRIKPHIEDFQRWVNSLTRPRAEDNARKLKERGESLDSIVFRDATFGDLMALSELHVLTWNMTYNTTRGPTIETRAWQWAKILGNPLNRDIVVVLESAKGQLIGFYRLTFGESEWKGQLNKIYLRWEYHGLGLGRKMMGHAARRFLERGANNFVLFAERSNPTIGFYDRMGGERLLDEHGQFHGGYGWRDMKKLAQDCPV